MIKVGKEDRMIKSVFKNMKKHLMSGISYMIPVIVMGGFMTAFGRMFGNVDVEGTLGYICLTAGSAAFSIMIPVLCAGIAYSICGKPGIAPGVVCGFLSNQVKAGFLGALIVGVIIGIVILYMNEIKIPKAMKSLMPIVILPLISGAIGIFLIMVLIGPILAQATEATVLYFKSLDTTSKFVIGFMMGCMTGFDMGGPINKICFSVVAAFNAEGWYGPPAGKNAAAMAPPLGMAISALLLTPKKYTQSEREDAKVALAMSACQVTEGALPFAFNDPLRVIPAVTIGSGIAHGLVLSLGVEVPVLHGGIFSIPLCNNPLLFVLCWFTGAMVTALIVSILKPKSPTIVQDIEEDDIGDIEINIV